MNTGLIWQYSRNQRRHTAYDATGKERFEIVSMAPYGEMQGKHGYRLRYPSGGHIQYSIFVSILKGVANAILAKSNQPSK